MLFITLILFTVWLTDLRSGVYASFIWGIALIFSYFLKKSLLVFNSNSFLALYYLIILGLFIINKVSLFTVILYTFIVLFVLYSKICTSIVDEEKLQVKGLKSFFKDFKIIENHFKNDFQIFYGLKQVQLMLVLVYVFSSFLFDFNAKMSFFLITLY